MLKTKITWNLKGLKKLNRLFSQSGSASKSQLLNQIGRVYMAFISRRYHKYSRGGGDWAPLAPATIRQRRSGSQRQLGVNRLRTGGNVAILVNDALLISALGSAGRPGRGGVLRVRGTKLRVGFSDTAKHAGAGITFAALADIHQRGNPRRNLPARPILVEPDQVTIETIRALLRRAVERNGRIT
jgi:hypothetical protein